jgi:hypothetical protein
VAKYVPPGAPGGGQGTGLKPSLLFEQVSALGAVDTGSFLGGGGRMTWAMCGTEQCPWPPPTP